ncbi:Rz1-like lysis system protein LysC [Aliivibrio salmonicida]
MTVGCTSNQPLVVTEYVTLDKVPPAAYLTECEPPFSLPPKTYGEAVERDQVWLCAFEACAMKVIGIRWFYNIDSQYQPLCTDDKKATQSSPLKLTE